MISPLVKRKEHITTKALLCWRCWHLEWFLSDPILENSVMNKDSWIHLHFGHWIRIQEGAKNPQMKKLTLEGWRLFLICRMFEKLEKMTVRRKILIRKCAPYI
jgi:hypothetical protein